MTGSSKGFEGGCKQLFSAFGKGVRENAGKVPVIALGVSKYKHSNPAFGMLKHPGDDPRRVVRTREGARERS